MQDGNQTQNTTQVETPNQFKVIKRYANRKLYDTEESQYVTLTQVQDFVKAGREVIVIDNASKRDITAKTLLASIIETESEREDLSTSEVVALIKRGLSTK
jgi:polyhydroxyalkanoate synthesis repressor PhaR